MSSNVVHADFSGGEDRTVKSADSSAEAHDKYHNTACVYTICPEKYQIIEQIGSGGMGTVWKARQVLLDKFMAIKMMNKCDNSEDVLMRFQQEAKSASMLNHPNLVAFRDFGVTASGKPYMVMDFIEGKTVADRISDSGPIELTEALDIFIQALCGLTHAHEHGVLHRDIKPSNIMISDTDHVDKVKIVDFGIAKAANATQNLTQTGEVFGTPLYMSPEQGLGKKLDARSDLYSMGCVMYEALTGVPPFRGGTAIETIFMHQTGNLPPMSVASGGVQFPSPIEHIVSKMLAKDPDDRYQSARQAKDELMAIKKGKTAAASTAPANVVNKAVSVFNSIGKTAKIQPGEKSTMATIESIIIKSVLIICSFLTIICVAAIVVNHR